MCFRFGPCFGSGSGQDYGRSTPKWTHRGGGRSHRWSQPDHGAGTDHRVPPVAAYHDLPAANDDVYNAGGARKDHADNAHGQRYGQLKAAGEEVSRQPAAWSGKVVGDDTGYTYNAAADYHYYPTMNTTPTTVARY